MTPNRMAAFVLFAIVACALPACSKAASNSTTQSDRSDAAAASSESPRRPDAIVRTEEEWRRLLTAEQFEVLRRKGTEAPFSGKYSDHHESGTYVCAACDLTLFRSQEKFDSGTGWPSFTAPLAKDAVAEHSDGSHGMRRTEVTCARCGGHLGHVFEDGPPPTGLRYCINSVSLQFVPTGAASPRTSR